VGGKDVSPAGIVIVTVLLALVAGLALFSMLSFWPLPLTRNGTSAEAVSQTTLQTTQFTYFRWQVNLTRDQQYFVIVALAGVLGAMIHGLRSLGFYVGNRAFVKSWIASYLLLPFVGAVIATIVYLVLRAGLLPGATSGSQPDPFGIAAIGAMVGWFSGQAAEKMKKVFEELFSQTPSGSDSITAKPTITKLAPRSGRPDVEVTITGTNLGLVDRVTFAGNAEADITSTGDTEVTVVVPQGAKTGPITLSGKADQVTSKDIFTVDPAPAGGAENGRPSIANAEEVLADPRPMPNADEA
jgi:hypothetical protein